MYSGPDTPPPPPLTPAPPPPPSTFPDSGFTTGICLLIVTYKTSLIPPQPEHENGRGDHFVEEAGAGGDDAVGLKGGVAPDGDAGLRIPHGPPDAVVGRVGVALEDDLLVPVHQAPPVPSKAPTQSLENRALRFDLDRETPC